MRKRIIAEKAFLVISVARLFLVKIKEASLDEFLLSDGYKNDCFKILYSVSYCRQENGNMSAQDHCVQCKFQNFCPWDQELKF